jgi:hypothetical protein
MTSKLQHIIFTRKQLQDRKTFYNIHQHLRERWAFVFVAVEIKEDTRNEMNNETLDKVAKFPVTSTWRTAAAQHISRLTVFSSSAGSVRSMPTRLLPK